MHMGKVQTENNSEHLYLVLVTSIWGDAPPKGSQRWRFLWMQCRLSLSLAAENPIKNSYFKKPRQHAWPRNILWDAWKLHLVSKSYTFPVLVPEQVNDAQHYTPRLAPFVLTGSSWQLPLSYQSHSNLGQTRFMAPHRGSDEFTQLDRRDVSVARLIECFQWSRILPILKQSQD